MLAGYLPFADQIEDSDVIIISKDGVHLYQASAAGIGGGLRYWVETEDEIYRVADITALSALTYDETEPVWKYTWHGAPMSESNIQHAVYTALDSSGKQPDYILPKDSELSKAVNDPTVPVNFVNIKPKVLSPYYSGNEQGASQGPPDVNSFDYCRDFNQLYIGWLPINVTNWFIDPFTEDAIGAGCYIYDLAFEYQHWYKTSPTLFSTYFLPTNNTSVSYNNEEDLYNAVKTGILAQWDENDPNGDDYWTTWPQRLNYCIDVTGINEMEPLMDSLRNDTYTGDISTLIDTCLGRIGWNSDPLGPPSPGEDSPHAIPGSYRHTVYDRRLGKTGKYHELVSGQNRYNSVVERAQARWDEVYDPDPTSPTYNPTPGGFNNFIEYRDYMINIEITSGSGSGLMSGYPDHTDASTIDPVTKEIPFIVIISCVGYYPDYQLKPLTGDNNEDIDFPRSKWHYTPYNFPGFSHTTQQGYAYKPSYGETANFSDNGNAYTNVSGTAIERVLRGPSICVDYKDENGYVWEVGFFAANSHWVDGDTLSIGGSTPIVTINGNETYNIRSLNKIKFEKYNDSFTHWSMNPSLLDNVHDAAVFSRSNDEISIYKYSVLNEGAGEAMIDSARNIAATIVRETGLKAFKAFEGSQIAVRTNIGINTNEGFKTGLEVVDFDDVKKFEETSYVDPVTGAGWFKGTLTANGGLVQKKLKAGPGITITPGDKEDTISSTGGGGAVDVDTILALMEKGPGITPIKDVLNNKIRIDLKHDINVKNTSTNYISIERSYKEDSEEPGTSTNEYVDEVDLKMTAIRNDIYNASHMVKGTGGLDFSTNTGTGQVTISTDTISNITVNGEPATKSYDSETGKYNVDLQISSGEDDYDISLPIPDYVNRVFLSDSVWYTPQTYTAPSDGVLFLEASYSDTVSLPVTIDSFTWKLGRKANGVGSRHDSHNMIFVKEGTVLTFGTRVPSSGWASNASTSGIKLWFIPFETMKASEFDGDTVPYILPYPDYSTRAAQISSSSVPTVYDDPSWYTYTSTVDGIMVANPRSTAGNYIVSPLDDNDNVVGTYVIASSSGESQLEHDYLPIRKGKKYKIQKSGSPFDINIFAYKTTSDISELYSPYLDFSNPISKSVTTSSSSSTYYDIWGTGEGDFPALLINNLVEPASLPLANLRIKTSSGSLSEIKLTFSSSDNNNPSWPLMPSSLYSSKYQVLDNYYSSGDLKVLKYQKFEPPVAPKRILYNGQNLVDSNGDVDLTFLKQLIDDLDARITALGG